MDSLQAALARIAQLEAQLARVTAELETLRGGAPKKKATTGQVKAAPPPQPPMPPSKPAPELKPTGTSAILEITSGGPPGLKLTVPKNKTVTLGRSEQATYELHGDRVSRKHCAFKLGDVLHIADLGSQNGTAVNGERIGEDPVVLRAGDLITIGSLALAVRSLGAAST